MYDVIKPIITVGRGQQLNNERVRRDGKPYNTFSQSRDRPKVKVEPHRTAALLLLWTAESCVLPQTHLRGFYITPWVLVLEEIVRAKSLS